ncbi:hypothetical protein Sste5346_003769 [Sporothrix stenoceras]|uniref:Histidine acid phosphatase n=1 Tax=Sporothrix stenoceras TaxID=5173 RepID=A0ABR3ZCC1_9PEZI
MTDTAIGRWAVRIVVGMGLFLAIHSLVLALVASEAVASMRPWPLSIDFAFFDSSDGDHVHADEFHNFGAPQEPDRPPPGSPWYAPRVSDLNNLSVALSPQTKGVYGFLFNDSTTPDGVPYGTYNWCNMPHVRADEYVVPPAEQKRSLVYVELVHRHHKRTPYASNGFPHEPYNWECDDARIHLYGDPVGNTEKRPGVAHYVPTFDAPSNPFLAAAPAWHGSCQFPQLTSGGLEDAWQHGVDLYKVYHDLLGFLPAMTDADAWSEQVAVRVTNNPITSQTVTMVLGGMAAAAGGGPILDTPLLAEAAGFDSLEPQYTCPAAVKMFKAITAASTDYNDNQGGSPVWAEHLEQLEPLFAKLDAASGVDPEDPHGFHESVDHYYDNLSARQCHGKPPVEGISQDEADTVFRVGQWEYSRMYRDDVRSLATSVGAWGVWVAQLAGHLRVASSGNNTDKVRYRHNVAHDGSLSRLLSILQADEMVWPGMGSEVVVELWKKEGEGDENEDKNATSSYDVRILFSGKVLRSSHPKLGLLDMVPLDALLTYIDGLVGVNASLLPAKCNGTSPL